MNIVWKAAGPCALATAMCAANALAATKSYQVTGPVTAVDGATISVQKDKETWTLERDPAAKVTGAADVKVGDKVTIQYAMKAKSIEVKPAKKQ